MQFDLQSALHVKVYACQKRKILVKRFALQGFRLFLGQKCSKIKVFNIMNRVLNNLIVENLASKFEK